MLRTTHQGIDEMTTKNVRMWITVQDHIKRAFESAARARDISEGDLLKEMVETHLPNDLAHVEAILKRERKKKSPTDDPESN